jgi:hypothetical protein
MAVRKTNSRKTARKPPSKPASKGKQDRTPTSAAFWTFLIIVIIIAFFMLVPVIKRNLIPKPAETEQRQEQPEITAPDPLPKPPEEKPAVSAQSSPPKTPEKEPETKPQTEKPAEPVQPSAPPAKPVETRDRSIYLLQEANMTQVRVNRKLNVSDTPLKDSINALLSGPTAEERRRGMISLVPEGSRLLSAPRVDGSTVYLDFNQEFRYNTRGREGCAAQIKQIVWTATEFSNVQDVQFLIEGEKVYFLSEGVVINSPIGR